MRALAGLKHSETAFVRRTGEGSFHIRYFTPAGGGPLRPRHHRLLHRPAGEEGHRARYVCPAHPLRRPVHPGGRGRGVDGHGAPRRRPELFGGAGGAVRRHGCPWPTGRRAWRPRR